MGVPKFYRWISERYPKINQIISDQALLPQVDHLYLDLNGIIHGCTHPSHLDVSDVLSEKDMMLGIMHYLDRILNIIKPQVSVYMAIDGVAPRAKLNQQRSRRFRSAKDMQEKALPEGTDVFDSNCITPGTEFLEKVSAAIQYFIRKKLHEEGQAQALAQAPLTIIFSGHDVPGEGEHKIMQHIREMRASPNYPANSTHCIYGQDADLIMLGLVTHEPHFCILREVIDFNHFNHNNGSKTLKIVKKFTKESDFQLLHLSVLREYLAMEFCQRSPTTDNSKDDHHPYNLERVIDDFVFMTFLVGNDFLPHMPSLDIGDDAFDLLFNIYRAQRPSWGNGGYLTESGSIVNARRLETFFAAIGAAESDILKKKEEDEIVYLKKKRRWDKRDGKTEGPSDAQLKADEATKHGEYSDMIQRIMDTPRQPEDFVAGWTPVTEADQKDFKGRYYFEKLRLTPIDKGHHWELRKSYMEGLIWCLAYYYKGCISWGWFYPYHYGPMLSDLIDLESMFTKISFEEGTPLTPFQQLMGCLPPASAQLVPKLYRSLMLSPESPIIQFYPQSFNVDMNGKKNPWEGVNLLPFIDVTLLKDTIANHCPESKLSNADRKRNSVGKVYCYRFDNKCNDTVLSPNRKIGLPDISGCRTSVLIIDKQEMNGTPFKPVLIPGTRIPYPGFPSLNVLPFASVQLTRIGVNVFGSPSKYPTMVLSLHQMPDLPPLEVLAETVIGKSLFINWPMMHEGRVVAISNEEEEIRLIKGKRVTKKFKDLEIDRWHSASELMKQVYHVGNGEPGSGGVVIGEVSVRLKLLPLQGIWTDSANGSRKKLFGNEEADVPLQLALWQAPAPDPRFEERGPLTLGDRFPLNCTVVLTKGKYRGCKGVVIGVADQKNVGVKVQVFPSELPFGLAIARSVQETFMSSIDAARILRIPAGVLGKLTGKLQFEQGKYDLGLNLKAADGTCVVGYTRKKLENIQPSAQATGCKTIAWRAGDSVQVIGSDRTNKAGDSNGERIQWEYSSKAIELVKSYRVNFPQLFSAIIKNPDEKKYDANKVFGPNGEACLLIVREWLDKHESAKLPRSPATSDSMSFDAVTAIQKAADLRSLALQKRGFPKDSLIKIPGNALYREGCTGSTDILLASDLNNNEAPELGDRIVNICADGIPFGARGTIVGIHDAARTGSVDVVMDEEFIGGTTLQGLCASFRGKLCLWVHLLKISPVNSDRLLDKMIPKGSGRSDVNRILASIQREVSKKQTQLIDHSQDKTTSPAARASSVTASASSNDEGISQPRPEVARASSTSRSGSADRSRQGGWREAKGPDGESFGFSGVRLGRSGVECWKQQLKKVEEKALSSKSTDALRTILGVHVPDEKLKPAHGDSASGDAANNLKVLLGVGKSGGSPPNHVTSATAELKNLLGVDSSSLTTPSMEPPSHPSTAAEKLMQLIASREKTHSIGLVSIPKQTAFNFTYVDKGEDPEPTRPNFLNQPPPHPHPGLLQFYTPA